ncbi:MAG: hypothetical protein V2I33_20215 [Kangiellaceae bacterium]|nr:hypothetical protein [Kangiellaceae bacterium]
MADDSGVDGSDVEDQIVLQLLYFIPSLCVVSINFILAHVIRILSRLEQYPTNTEFNTSVSIKITVALFINSAIVAIVVYQSSFYENDGLINEIYNIILVNAAVSPLVPIFHPLHFLNRFRRWYALRQGKECKLTQQQANELFQGIPIDMAKQHANIMKTYLLAMFYGPVLPIAYPITLLSLLGEFWVQKILLIRRHCRPAHLSNNIDRVMVRVVPVGIILM